MALNDLATLSRSARPRHVSAKFVQEVNADQNIIFTIFVRRCPDGPMLPDLEYWQKTSLRERKFLSSEEYAKMYGSSAEDMTNVTTSMEQRGMTVLSQHTGSRTVTVKASVAHVYTHFGTQLKVYKCPTPMAMLRRGSKKMQTFLDAESETHIGYDGDISVPIGLKGIISHVIGLDTRSIAAPAGFSGDPINSFLQSVPAMAGIYNFPNLTASDQTIGIFCGGGSYLSTDVTNFFKNMPAAFNTEPKIIDISLTVGSTTYENSPSSVQTITNVGSAPGGTLEITQDIMTSTTIAQGCTANIYFSDLTEQGWVIFLNRVIFPQTEKRPNCVSISWLMFDENTYGSTFSNLFQQLAVVGISVFAAAGDWGAADDVFDGNEHVGYPACDPWVVGVGGTVVGNVNAGPPATFDEYVWSDEKNVSSNFTFPGGGTTGGGMSIVFPMPSYQVAANITQFTDSANIIKKGGRFVPDIAGMVGYTGFLVNNLGYNFIGTSCSTPLYAGLFTALQSTFGQSFGFLNPSLYQFSNSAFKDITFGNNDPGNTPDSPFFLAATGYDPTTGLGSVDGTRMMTSLGKTLYPPKLYLTVIKGSFGLEEVENHAIWDSTILIILDGFSSTDLANTIPSVVSALGSDVVITVGVARLGIANQPSAVQRISFPITIEFSPESRHTVDNPTTPGIFPTSGSPAIKKSLTVDYVIANTSFKAMTNLEFSTATKRYPSPCKN